MIHANSTGLINYDSHKKNYRKIYQLELDGNIIKQFDGIVNAEKDLDDKKMCAETIVKVCVDYKKNKYSTTFGYCWCYVGTKYAQSFETIFPELIGRNDIDFDVIRKYIINISRSIWLIDLDGTRIKQYNSMNEGAIELNITMQPISASLKNSNYLVGGYAFRYVSYEDMINKDSYKIKNIPDKIKNIFNIQNDYAYIHPKIIKLLKENIDSKNATNIKTPPVVQETVDEQFIQVYPSPAIARYKLGFGRGAIEEVLKGKNKTSGGFKFRYLELDNHVLDLI